MFTNIKNSLKNIYSDLIDINNFKNIYYNNTNFINIEIKDIISFYNIEYDISKILYYNDIKYKTFKKENKIILKIYLNEIDNYFYDNFSLNDLYEIINLDIDDSKEYLISINNKLNSINW